MNASAVIVAVAIVFVASIAGGLLAIAGIVAEIITRIKRLRP